MGVHNNAHLYKAVGDVLVHLHGLGQCPVYGARDDRLNEQNAVVVLQPNDPKVLPVLVYFVLPQENALHNAVQVVRVQDFDLLVFYGFNPWIKDS